MDVCSIGDAACGLKGVYGLLYLGLKAGGNGQLSSIEHKEPSSLRAARAGFGAIRGPLAKPRESEGWRSLGGCLGCTTVRAEITLELELMDEMETVRE